MILCRECGHRNADGDEFCGGCATFLEFSGEHIDDPAPPAVEEPPVEPEPHAPGLVERVRSAVGLDRAEGPVAPPESAPPTEGGAPAEAGPGAPAGHAPAEAPAAAEPADAVPPAPESPPAASSPPVAPSPSAGPAAPPAGAPAPAGRPAAPPPDPGARPPTPQGADPTPGAQRPGPGSGPSPPFGAQKPQEVRRRPARPAPVEEVVNPGDVVCGSCGVGNDPGRSFCRRCGGTLAGAEVAAPRRLPWYRRLFARRPPAPPEAGTRRAGAAPERSRTRRGATARGRYAVSRAKSVRGKVGRLLALAAVVGAVGFSLGPGRSTLDDWFQRARRVVSPEFDPVRPASVSATSELGGHPAAAAVDQIRNSYWAEGAEGNGEGEGLTFEFQEPVDLAKVGFTSGASASPEDFVTQPRIRELQLLFDDGTTARVELDDEAGFQSYGVERSGVTRIQLQILSVYPSLDGDAASLAEIEFFVRR